MFRVFGILLLLSVPFSVFGAEYLLGAGDRLRLRAVIWNEADRNFEAWDVVGGEYVVQADGTLSIPIVGSVAAAGKSLSAVSETISKQLEVQGGNASAQTIALEVLSYRPFYVTGDVRNPGAFSAPPGLTAVQAVALAGGAGGDAASQPSDLIRETGSLRQIRAEIARSRIREARLGAEIAGDDDFAVPKGLEHPGGSDALELIEAQERAIFEARREELARELGALNDLDTLLSNEVAGLERKLDGQRAQLDLARETMESAESLVQRGLAPASRLADAQARLINLEGSETDILNALYRARQRISENQRDTVALQARRETAATVELQRTTAELEDLGTRRSVLEEIILSQAGADALEATETRTTYLLRSGSGDGDGVTEIGPGDQVAPGDVLSVVVEIIDGTASPAN